MDVDFYLGWTSDSRLREREREVRYMEATLSVGGKEREESEFRRGEWSEESEE